MLGRVYRDNRNDLAWTVVGLGAAAVGGVAIRSLIKSGWLAYYDEYPPLNPASPDTGWRQAILFSALMGAGAGLASMLSRRAAAEGWRQIAGNYPRKLRRGERRLRA